MMNIDKLQDKFATDLISSISSDLKGTVKEEQLDEPELNIRELIPARQHGEDGPPSEELLNELRQQAVDISINTNGRFRCPSCNFNIKYNSGWPVCSKCGTPYKLKCT